MEGSNKHIPYDDVKRKLESINLDTEPVIPQNKSQSYQLSPFIEAAAVLVFYNPEDLIPMPYAGEITSEQRQDYINALIGCSEFVSNTKALEKQTGFSNNLQKNKLLLTLRDDVRKEALNKLITENNLSMALQANRAFAFDRSNITQRVFTDYLQNKKISIAQLNLEELNSLAQVSNWLKGLPAFKEPFPTEEILAQLELSEMLTPLKHLTGVYENGFFRSTFRGRHSEISALRSYVGVAPPQGIRENISRKFDSFFSSTNKKPLFIFGIGGIGKSTLLANFILEHVEAHKKDRFPFVYLDFDRTHLNALEPETLLIEAARQLCIQYRDLKVISENFLSFYYKWNKVYSSFVDESHSEIINLKSVRSLQGKEKSRAEVQTEFLKLVMELAAIESKPFLVVLDTFEEVQYKGKEYVKELYSFMMRLREAYPQLRTVIAGRAPMTNLETIPLELKSLDQEAAQGYLLRLGIPDGIVARNIAIAVGGNPLTLKLTAEVVKKYGEQVLSELRITKSQYVIFSTRLPEIEIQGILYKRILDHLHNPNLKKLAHPGMVLRKITPEIILNILAEPCGLKITEFKEAVDLFNEFSRELALVIPEGSNVLRHRPDVRKVMLNLIRQSDKQQLATQIDKRAVEYYRKKEGMENRAEEFYHRLALDESPRDLESRWIDGIQNLLLGNIDELPAKARAYVLGKAGIESGDLSIWESADMEDQQRHIAKQVANLLNSGRAESALEVLQQIQTLNGNEILSMLKARALSQLHRYNQAKEIVQQTLSSFYADKFAPAVTAELQRILNLVTDSIDSNIQDKSNVITVTDAEYDELVDESDAESNDDSDLSQFPI
jgi:hypothetical protein